MKAWLIFGAVIFVVLVLIDAANGHYEGLVSLGLLLKDAVDLATEHALATIVVVLLALVVLSLNAKPVAQWRYERRVERNLQAFMRLQGKE